MDKRARVIRDMTRARVLCIHKDINQLSPTITLRYSWRIAFIKNNLEAIYSNFLSLYNRYMYIYILHFIINKFGSHRTKGKSHEYSILLSSIFLYLFPSLKDGKKETNRFNC